MNVSNTSIITDYPLPNQPFYFVKDSLGNIWSWGLGSVEINFMAAHNIAVTDVTPYKTVVGQGGNLSINITVANQGIYTETFNITVYANITVIKKLTGTDLTSGNLSTITVAWNTTGFAKGTYIIRAVADTVPYETDTTDNAFIDGSITVAMAGDIVPDGTVDIFDLVAVGSHFGHSPPDGHLQGTPEYTTCFNADVNGDGEIDIFDLVAVGTRFGQTDP